MNGNIKLIMMTTALAVTMIVAFSCLSAVAQTPPPIPPDPDATPTPVPQPSGGSSSPPSYSAPSFQPYTLPLLSGDGTVIGNLTGVDLYTVRLWAGSNATIHGGNCSFMLIGDLDQKPVDAAMDIRLASNGTLPRGMDAVRTIMSANVTDRSMSGWPFKSQSLKITCTVPASGLASIDNGTEYYLVRYDGNGFQVLPTSLTMDGDNATFQASPQGETGLFTLVAVLPPAQAQIATPTPAPLPTSTPVPTPTPGPVGLDGSLAIGALMFVFGVIAGALALLIVIRVL